MSDRRPEPPAGGLDPLFDPWPADRVLMRVFTASYEPAGFNPTASPGRFRPIYSGPAQGRVPVPTIYAAVDSETAIAEGLLRTELIDSEQAAYAWTARWAQALHDQVPDADGLVWTSRQNDSAKATILWRDRVAVGELVGVGPVVALDRDRGLELIRQAALDADITFEG